SDNKRKHSGQGTFRLAYQPDELNPSQFGAFINIDRINARDAKLKYVDQLVTGLFAHMDWNNARITTAGYYVDDRLKEIDRTHSSGFLAAYLHAEYELGFKWTGYARVERTAGGQHDEYMEYFGDPNLERNLVGIRFDITRRQAISSEISQRLNEHDSHTHISLQWSAVFP
ncbi:MAG: hypothetical protein R3240_04615, partial [Gammaproteobacteria bacterium]|nr:hypothetical protein [Gammaproteobacteria bacterium]